MRVLFVDRVVRLHRFKAIEAILSLSPDEPIFAFHFPGNPMLPASQQIECFAQVGTILLEASHDFSRKAFPGYVRDAKFRRPVRPDHPLEVTLEVEQWAEEGALLRGRATQCGRLHSDCTMGLVTAPLGQFYRPENADAYRDMYERWLRPAVLEGFEGDLFESLSHALVG